MSVPKVTVICSNFNSARWITGYCDSLNSQLLCEFDVIFVDANSTDGSVVAFRGFGFRPGVNVAILEVDARINVYEAWNLALGRSRTDYFMNVNTDDRIYPAALSSMLAYAERYPDVDLFYSRCYVTDDPDHARLVDLYDWPEYSHAQLLRACICGPFPLVKRATVVEAGMFDPKFHRCGDYEMWLRMSKRGCTFRKVPETIGSYFRNPNGISTDRSSLHEVQRQNAELWRLYA